jgi:Tfp pilus assembly PilM family ATPase
MKIAKIFLCGGASRMPGFSNFLERSLRLEIQPPNIFSKVRYSKHDFDPKYLDYYNPQAVTAFGLALRLMGE